MAVWIGEGRTTRLARSTMEQLATPVRAKKGVHGHLVIHSAPSALRTHIEWALQHQLGASVEITWLPQPHSAGTFRTTISYKDLFGVASQLASTLRGWHYIRFELTECDGTTGEMYRFTPELGLHRATIDGSGSVLVEENKIIAALSSSFDEESLRECIEKALGTAWDRELEIFRGVELQEIVRLRAI